MNDRVLPFEGIHNFRDYGGYRAGDGVLARGRLWRSAHHSEAADPDLAGVHDLGLATIVDLRGDGERAMHPCRRAPGFAAPVLFARGETAGMAPHLAAAASLDSEEIVAERMVATYTDMPFRPVLIESMKLYFAALADSDGPTLVHCVAGKDRTGLAVGLFHALMGVHEDDILADYLMTNVAGRVEARMAQGGAHVRAIYGAHVPDAVVRTIMSVRPDYLQAAFASIRARHGSVEGYAEAVLGVDAARRQAIAARVTA